MENHFSVEEVYHEKPMGYHIRSGAGRLPEGVWKNKEQRKAIIKYCPEISIILDMKLEKERCEGDNGEGEVAYMPTNDEKRDWRRSFVPGGMSVEYNAQVPRD